MRNLNWRKAQTSDVSSIVRLVNGAYRGETGRKGWTTEAEFLDGQRIDEEWLTESLKTPNHFVLVAFDSTMPEKILGCVEVEAVKDRKSYFGMLTVDVEEQKSGIGDFLIRSVEDFARRELSSHTMIMGVISLRKELIEYYQRRGYKPTGEMKPFPYGNERFGIPKRPDLEFMMFEKIL